MHTFFINTSGKELENYSDIFEIQHETRRLVSLECPLAEWTETETGYETCVRKMEEMIDSYKDINNDFNLIVYIDLLNYHMYTAIPMLKHRNRYACLRAMHSILKHYVKSTLIDLMKERGRVPREVLLIFEENQPPNDGDKTTEDGKQLIRTYAKECLGLPDECDIDKIIYNDKHEVIVTPEQFCEKVKDLKLKSLTENVLNFYLDEVDTFISEAKTYDECSVPVSRLLDKIVDCSDEYDETLYSISFITNRLAGISNKQEYTRRNLRLCLYILACIEDGTFLDSTRTDERNNPLVKDFPELDWEEVAAELGVKCAVFQKKYHETQRLSESFTEMKLAPPLYSFDNRRFALDEYGRREKVFDIVDVEDAKDEEKESKDVEEGIVRPKDKKAVVVKDATANSLLSKEEYPLFDYRGENYDDSILGRKAPPEQYVAEAQKLRKHHLDYLQRLKVHVSDRLSNYAGRSDENDPALLRKRKVSVAEEDFEDTARDYIYAKPGKTEENRKLKTVEDIAETAYTSTLLDYMEFCAGRSVAVTDIEEQCNWFVTRVHQIKESLRKIQLVAIGLFLAIIALYVPFAVLQWEAITQNALTLTVALASVAVPIVLLILIVVVASAVQRKKYRKAWKEFKEKSDLVLEENAIAAEKYDRLLSVYVPTLRWVYEYKLDVEFYADCCKMARAKIGHHIQKLHDRVVTIGNIIEDLETDTTESVHIAEKSRKNSNDEIDYNVSFCSGKKNRKFYAIIDTQFLKAVNK